MKRLLKVAFACALALGVMTPVTIQPAAVYAAETKDVDALIKGSMETVKNGYSAKDANFGYIYLAMPQEEAGLKEVEATFLATAEEAALKENAKITDINKLILLVEGLGYDSTNYTYGDKTINLFDLLSFEKMSYTNDYIFTLEAMHAANYFPDATSNLSTEKLVTKVLSMRNSDGAWDYDGNFSWGPDTDSTAMALSGLAYYVNTDNTKTSISTSTKQELINAVPKALDFLFQYQFEDGCLGSAFGKSSNTTAITIVAMHALGIDYTTDTKYMKNGNSLMDGLLSLAVDDNSGFGTSNNNYADSYATLQSLFALLSYKNSQSGTPYYFYQAGAIKNENRFKEDNDNESNDNENNTTDQDDTATPDTTKKEPIVKQTSTPMPMDASNVYGISLAVLAAGGLFITKRKKA